jgi:parallel beta-helix repeat protein
MLEPGTYRLEEPLDVGKSLHLVGAGMDQTEIVSEGAVVNFSGDGPFAAEDITFRHQGQVGEANVVSVEGGEVAFVHCRFVGAVTGEELGDHAGLWLGGNTTGVVRECEAVENDNVGMLIVGQAQPTLEGNLCRDNELGIAYLDNAGGVARQNGCSGNGNGIRVGDQTQPMLEGNVCRDNGCGIAYLDNAGGVAWQNRCSGNKWGITVHDQAQPTLEGNVCTDSKWSGIGYRDNAGGVARQNECSGNGDFGIGVGDQAQPTLEGNICRDNEFAGIGYFGNASGVARQNECSGNTCGIFIMDAADPDLVDNDCHDNSVDILDERQ